VCVIDRVTLVTGCDSVCVGLAVGLVLAFLLVAAVVVFVIFYVKKQRKPTRRKSMGPHVSNIMVTPDRADDDISPYEYINPVGLNTSTSSLPTDSVVLSEPNGQKDIESEYITVNTSPSPRPDNTQHVCYI